MQYLLAHLLVTLSPSLFDFGAWFIQTELQETGHVGLCLGFLLLWGSWEQDAGSPGEFSLWPGNWVGSDFHWVGGEGASHWGALLCIFALFPRGCPLLFWGPRWCQFPCGGGAQRWWMVVLLGQALCLVCRSLKTWVFAKKSLFLHGDKRASLNLSPQMQSLRIFADSKSRVFQGIGIAEGLEEKPGSLSSGQVCSNVTAHRACVQKVTALPRSPVILPFDDRSSLSRSKRVIGGFPWLMFPPDSRKITSATVTHTPAVWPVRWASLWPVTLEEKTGNKITWAEEVCLALSGFQRAGRPAPPCLCPMLGPGKSPAAILRGSRGQPGYASSCSLPSAFSHLYSWAP